MMSLACFVSSGLNFCAKFSMSSLVSALIMQENTFPTLSKRS